MGGMGSGRRWHVGAKQTTDDYQSIDVRRWHRDGFLIGHRSFGWQWIRRGKVVSSIWVQTEPGQVILSYRYRSSPEGCRDERYHVYLDWTSCHLGGQRPWFLCPAHGCGRRVAILYGGAIFACRYCYRLAYPSQRESEDDRAARRADGIRKRLGWDPGILNGRSFKPKGMHWRTFERLTAKHDSFVEEALGGMARRFGIKL